MLDATACKAMRRPRFRRAEEAPAFQLTVRDVEIVHQVARHRFLRSTHISRLLDSSHKKISERLTSLYHGGYLDRPRSQLEYHARDGGTSHYIYALGNRGARLLGGNGETTHSNVDWTRRNRDSTRQFLLHTLTIADVRVALAVACRTHDRVTLQEPKQLFESLPEETKTSRRPWNWRVAIQYQGKVLTIGIVPDYVFALILPDGRRRPFSVECDRGTMPVERSSLEQTSMMRKFLAYEGARKQGIHNSRFGWNDFRVLVVTGNKERADNMRTLIERIPETKSSNLFLLADHAGLMPSDILTHPWCDARGAKRTLI